MFAARATPYVPYPPDLPGPALERLGRAAVKLATLETRQALFLPAILAHVCVQIR